jgi:hypothetical protein
MTQQASLKEKINSFLSGEYQVLEDRNVIEALPSIIVNLLEKNRIAEQLSNVNV